MRQLLAYPAYLMAITVALLGASVALPSLFRVCERMIRITIAGSYCAKYAEGLSVEAMLIGFASVAVCGALLMLGVALSQQE
jgi:hypothetical protein